MKISPEYLAGLIDGEGCLMVTKNTGIKEAKRGVRYQGVMTIANTYLPLMELILNQYGGRIREQNKKCYAIVFSAMEIREILDKVMPFLVIKKTQAEILKAFMDKSLERGPKNITDDDFAFSDECFRKLKELKRIRYTYDWSPKEIARRECPTCSVSFVVYSNRPTKEYCNDYCKRKACWTKSNKRIRLGIAPWQNK